ncbi:hypothetical protein FACS1894151_05430 [Spirochaetia bacterium]|nr:hypothetical protein FACS1894151_05430 [Spirochaetia bacterium]
MYPQVQKISEMYSFSGKKRFVSQQRFPLVLFLALCFALVPFSACAEAGADAGDAANAANAASAAGTSSVRTPALVETVGEVASSVLSGSAENTVLAKAAEDAGPVSIAPDDIEQPPEEDGLFSRILHLSWIIRLGIAAGIMIIMAVLIRLIWFLFARLQIKVTDYGKKRLKPLSIKNFHLLEKKQMLSAISFIVLAAKWVLTILLIYLTIPIVFNFFETTHDLAATLFGYILTPLKGFFFGAISYIPNLITIIIVLIIVKYVMRSLKFFVGQIERGRLVIPGFYADWAQPTFTIARILLIAFTVVIIYPYLPSSNSGIFQGVSVFVGLVVSLSSSAAIGNLVAGIVLTYMRPFKLGDRIKIGETTGFVVEKSPIVIRIKTLQNEYVTFPNQMVLNSNIVNYNTSSDEDEQGLIISTEVTMDYYTPWQKVHELLIAAAEKTTHIQKEPKPFVLQTALDNFFVRYQIRAYTKQINKLPGIYSELYQHIQDGFKEAGLDLTSPAYHIRLPPLPIEESRNIEENRKGEQGAEGRN